MQDFPANSQKARTPLDEPKKIERVTSAEVVRRKKGLGRQFKDTFIGGDAKMAAQYMAVEVIVPAIRDTLYDAVQGGIEKLIYGETRPRRPMGTTASGGPYGAVGRVAYNNMAQSSQSPPKATQHHRTLSKEARVRHDFGDIVIADKREANEVIDRMFDFLSRYGSVSLDNLYSLVGIQSSHVDVKWGWTQLRGARAAPHRGGGFVLVLPEPEPLG